MLINFDEIPIPSDKLDNIVSENLDAIKKQTRKKKQHRIFASGAAAAVLITAFSAFCISNPVLAVILAGMGIRASVKGRREREKNYLTCKVGVVLNILILICLLMIFVMGF